MSNDGGKTFEHRSAARARSTATTTRCGSTRATPTTSSSATTAASAISRDRGETWRFVGNLPLGQFYHVAVDMETPYNVYGGLQDNGSWRGPSAVWENGGIRNHHWQEVGCGDGFDTRARPARPACAATPCARAATCMRWNLRTGERKDIQPPEPGPERARGRCASTGTPASPSTRSTPATIYYGSQFVHKSTDRGETWTTISPDLTTDNPEWQQQARAAA